MKVTIISMILLLSVNSMAQEKARSQIQGQRVIPIVLDLAALQSFHLTPGDEAWLEIAYSVSPGGNVLFEEAGEKIWWIQGKPLLLLGSTGMQLPLEVTRRASAYVSVFMNGVEMEGNPFLIEPQVNFLAIGANAVTIQKSLSKTLAVNGTYLTQLANYLAENTADLDVQGSSYMVDSVGTVIDGSGEWVGSSSNTSFYFPGKMIDITAGTFNQGALPSEPCNESNEVPIFQHELTRNFKAMETEVTRLMWAHLKAFQTDLPSDPTDTDYGGGMQHPVQQVTWYEAVLFANLLSEASGLTPCYHKILPPPFYSVLLDATNYQTDNATCNFDANGYRLPTEGEWEYMTRAGTTGPFSIAEPAYTTSTCDTANCTSGQYPALETVATFCANDPGGTAVAGSKAKNPWGLKDMHGNVKEWCWDWLQTYPIGSVTDYTGVTSGVLRVMRGGSWKRPASLSRSANRNTAGFPPLRNHEKGFRLVRTIP